MAKKILVRRFERLVEAGVFATLSLRTAGDTLTRTELDPRARRRARRRTSADGDAADGPEPVEVETTFATHADAKAEMDRLARELTLAGWTEVPNFPEPGSTAIKGVSVSNPALEAALAKNLDDVDAWQIYADWLTEQGDIRGELVAAQLWVARRPHDGRLAAIESKLLRTYAKPLLGPLYKNRAMRAGEGMRQTYTWRNGFFRAARLWRNDHYPRLHDQTAALLEHPVSHLLEHLVLGRPAYADEETYERTFDVLERGVPATLTSFTIGEGFSRGAGDVSRVFRWPNLRRLRLHHEPIELGEIGESQLTSLVLDLGWLTPSLERSLEGARWPALETLSIPAAFLPAFAQVLGAPGRLRRLTINAPTAETIARLATSPALQQLERLTFTSIATLATLDAMLERAATFDAPRELRLQLTAAWSGSTIRSQLREAFPRHEAFSSKNEPDVLEGGWD
ncbi:MAG: TIGR02996 domain-containing protein [Polyangiaceae bacterium]